MLKLLHRKTLIMICHINLKSDSINFRKVRKWGVKYQHLGVAPWNRLSGSCPRGKLPPPPHPADNCLLDACPSTNNCPRTISPRKIDPRTITSHHKISLENNFPHSSKFPLKSTTRELRRTMQYLRVLWLKNHSTRSYFSRLQKVIYFHIFFTDFN